MARRLLNPDRIRRILEDLDQEKYDYFDGSDIENENEEQIQEDNYDTTSLQSATDEEMEVDCALDTSDDFQFYIGKDNETIWSSKPVSAPRKLPSMIIVKIVSGPKSNCRHTPKEIDAFLKFISLDMIDDIVKYTNLYIDNKRSEVNYGRKRDCKNTSRDEMMALIGVLFLIGVQHGGHTNCRVLWNDDGTGMPVLRATFSYKRFLFLLRSIRFDDLSTRTQREMNDKLAAIRNVYEQFLANCQNNYSLGELTTVDEMLIPFRGRCDFVQYMPNKTARYGLKLHALCDSKTFYMWNFEIHCGEQKSGAMEISNKPYDIVQRLCHGIKGSHRNITMDNYYTSYPLANNLLENGLTIIGTLKKDKTEIPPEFLRQSRKVGSCLYGFQFDITLASFMTKPKKCVLLLSTVHDKEEADELTKNPVINVDYNATKGCVDTVDQMCGTYSISRITSRWPLALFFRFLDLTGINSQVVFYHNNPDNVEKRRGYLSNLAFGLLETHLRKRAAIPTLPKDTREFLEKYRVPPKNLIVKQQEEKLVGPCHICGTKKCNRTTVKCGNCNFFVCKKHSVRVVKCEMCDTVEVKQEVATSDDEMV